MWLLFIIGFDRLTRNIERLPVKSKISTLSRIFRPYKLLDCTVRFPPPTPRALYSNRSSDKRLPTIFLLFFFFFFFTPSIVYLNTPNIRDCFYEISRSRLIGHGKSVKCFLLPSKKQSKRLGPGMIVYNRRMSLTTKY